MRIICLLSSLILLTISGIGQALPEPPLASPVQVGFYLPGVIAPRDYANPGFSGIFAFDYNLFFRADEYIDRNENAVNSVDFVGQLGSVPINVDISSYLNALLIGYSSPEIPWLGNARYLALLSPYYSTIDIRASYSLITQETTIKQNTGGFGDFMVTPILLSWALEDKVDITTGYYFTVPTGRYETGADNNIGLGYWNHVFQLFGYYYPFNTQKATAFFIGNSIEMHSDIKDVNVRPGSRFSLEYGISHYLHPRWEVFIQGGNIWQISADSGSDVYWDTSVKDRFSNVGGGVGFWPVPGKFYANLKYMNSYGESQHFNTRFWGIELQWIPWIRTKTNKPQS
ncbi:MAG: transporter [Flavobacteriaceae bacterium]